MGTFFSAKINIHECIEKAFFRTIIMICLVGCVVVVVFDLIVFRTLATSVHLTAICIFLLLIILYTVNKVPFESITSLGVISLCALFTYRGLITNEFNHVTYTILITLGFINALVSRHHTMWIITIIIFICLMSMLFKDFEVIAISKLIRHAVPYLVVFFIVTICSAFLKMKYEANQLRLKEMVELLNKKNRMINIQNELLKRKFIELEDLNANLERVIDQKTCTIREKNRQLADIAYTNAHTIRGPLARILGLVNLIYVDAENKDFYIGKLHKEAEEMDTVLITVTKQIEVHIHE